MDKIFDLKEPTSMGNYGNVEDIVLSIKANQDALLKELSTASPTRLSLLSKMNSINENTLEKLK